MQGLALVDWYNFRRRDQNSKADLELVTMTIAEQVSRAFAALFPAAHELDLRLYGGWINEQGWPSRHASWLQELLPALRGRCNGLIVRPALATSMIQFPEFHPRGTVRRRLRPRTRNGAARYEQKMVDGMLACDALYAAAQAQTCVGIVTDDDDLLPSALSARASHPQAVVWMRTKEVGSAMNDAGLLSEGLIIHRLRT